MDFLFIIDDLFVWLPLNTILMAAEQIHQRIGGQGEREETKLRKRLVELRLRYEMDDLDEQEYQRATAEVTQQLQLLREQEQEGVADAGDT